MARILIGEPDSDVCRLLVHVLRSLGHEPVVSRGDGKDDPEGFDVALLEATPAASLELARALRGMRADLPIVFHSVRPRDAATEELDPLAYLVKPATKRELQAAIVLACERSGRP